MAEEDELLKVLEAHGRTFLDSFASDSSQTTKKRKLSLINVELDQESEDEEWQGIQTSSTKESEDGNETEDDFEHSDDEFMADSRPTTKVVIFSDPSSKQKANDYVSKAHMKAFMSSRVSKVTASTITPTRKVVSSEDEEERSNTQNDAQLHHLIHTKLLSGSLNSELNMKPAQKKKAFAGRVLELTGAAKLGKGEKAVREAERKRAAKRVREGIADKGKEREKQRLEEAKAVGNYHPAIKTLFEGNKAKVPRRRERGLRMGVGKFSGGFLKLSPQDIRKVDGASSSHRTPKTRQYQKR